MIREHQQQLNNNQKGFVLWFTGLSGSGKSSLANALQNELSKARHNIIVLDGDITRKGLCSDLSFTKENRHENIRRIGEVSKLLVETGTIVIAAFISPYLSDREKVRRLFPPNDFIEIYCNCKLETCEARDPKGLYARARKGEIENFTGISSPYEEPINPEIIINTDKQTLQEGIEIIINTLLQKELISSN